MAWTASKMLSPAESRINSAVDRLLARLAGVPVEALYRAPTEGEWPVMSTLAHVVEMLPYWAASAQRIAQAPGATFGRSHDDPGRLGAIAGHAADPLEVVRTSLMASRDEALSLLRGLPESAWALSGQHWRRGPMLVSDLVDEFMVRHVEEHVMQVEASLAALGYSPSHLP